MASGSASLTLQGVKLRASATCTLSSSASLTVGTPHLLGTGIVRPPPPKIVEITVRDSIQVDDSTDAKVVTEGELVTYLKELDELSKRSQQLIVEWVKENPVLAPIFVFILCQVIIQLIDALFE